MIDALQSLRFAEIDLSGLLTEKFLVAVGATTGSLAALAIGASFLLVKKVVDSEASTAKITLVRWFMALCGGALAVSAAATITLAINNRGKTETAVAKADATATREKMAVAAAAEAKVEADANRRAIAAAIGEKSALLALVEDLRGKAANIEENNTRLQSMLAQVRREPALNPAIKSQLERDVSTFPATVKLSPQIDSVLKKFDSAPKAPAKP